MLLRQSPVVGSVSTPEDLAGDDDALSAPAQAFDHIPRYRLSITMSVSLGIIEEIHASIVSSRHTLDCNLLTHLPTIRDPGAQRELTEFESRASQLTIVHSSTSLFRWRFLVTNIHSSESNMRQSPASESNERDSM